MEKIILLYLEKNKMMGWTYLFIAVFFETAMILSMRLTPAFEKFWSGTLLFILIGIMMFFESLAIREIDLTIAYAIWVGVGLIAITLIDYFYFNVKINITGVVSLIGIVFFMCLLSFKGFK
jgi:small multidrug resistance pump